MDFSSEKKWFVYLGDHHEGPFGLDEIHTKMVQKQVAPETYVWCEGMADWRVMAEVDVFRSLLPENGGAPASTGGEGIPTEAVPVERGRAEPTRSYSHGSFERPVVVERARRERPIVTRPEELEPDRPRSGMKKWVVLLILAGGIYYAQVSGHLTRWFENPGVQRLVNSARSRVDPYLQKLAVQFPALEKYTSPIPFFGDASPAEYKELKEAAKANLSTEGPRLALAVGTRDPSAPVIYVASNLPDQTKLQLVVVGMGETLLNQFEYRAVQELTLNQKVAVSSPIKQSDERPIPRGEFDVYVVEADKQFDAISDVLKGLPVSTATLPEGVTPGKKLVSMKHYFLGGPKDDSYYSRLKSFHDKVQIKAKSELSELNEFAKTMNSQYLSSVTSFIRLRSGPKTKQKEKIWLDFSQKWNDFNQHLGQTFTKWTPEVLRSEYFYGKLYFLVQEAGIAVKRLHDLHHSFFVDRVDARAFDPQWSETRKQAEFAVQTLKDKIKLAESLPASPSGMPKREGL